MSNRHQKIPQKYLDFQTLFPRTEVDKPLADFSSIRIGGPADLFYALKNIDELPDLVSSAHQLSIPYIIIGGGTNVVFHENGFRGLIIRIQANKVAIENDLIIAEAGAALSNIVLLSLKHNLCGLQKLLGLPGTIGGAVRGNAGAHGIEIKDFFLKAEIYSPAVAASAPAIHTPAPVPASTRRAATSITAAAPSKSPSHQGKIHTVGPDYFAFSYRHSTLKQNNDIILKVYLKLQPGDCGPAMLEAQETLKSRLGKQPTGNTCGSFFKNPQPPAPGAAQHREPASTGSRPAPGAAGALLDQCGCKGLQQGQVRVSNEHANWIINLGGATQTDLITLAHTMQKRVKERFNINLIPEVQLIGETGFIQL